MQSKTLYAPLKPCKTIPENWAANICEWLNALGPDAAPFGKHSPKVTNGDVRRNWTAGSYAPHFKKI